MTLCVVMPAWNEGEGIASFVAELNDALSQLDPHFIVVNDCSTDNTADEVTRLQSQGVSLELHTNPHNSGHGPSTITALALGLARSPRAVVAVDGDGQFVPADVLRVATTLLQGGFDVVEGTRTSRNEPLYRRVVSSVTRGLVWSRCGLAPRDANTPLRAYQISSLSEVLKSVPRNSATPNLLISAVSRKWGLRIAEIPVLSVPRRGTDSGGTTWGKSRRSLPTRRFIKFCAAAGGEWLTTPIRGRSRT